MTIKQRIEKRKANQNAIKPMSDEEFSVIIKRGIFNKEPDEPLTILEHALLRDCLSGRVLKDAQLDPDDEDFLDHLQAYHIAKETKPESKEQVMRNVANKFKQWQLREKLRTVGALTTKIKKTYGIIRNS